MNSNRVLVILILPIFFSFLFSCELRKQENATEKPVARVHDEYIYPSELNGHIPDGLSEEDSAKIARRLIEEWIKSKLLLDQAEASLSDNQKDIEKQVEEYRSSLLIFKYKQNMLTQHLDTLVTDPEIQEYYNENASNYILDGDMVRVTYVKAPSSAPQIGQVRYWYRSNNEEDINKLIDYCNNYAEKCIINGNEWIRFTDLVAETPLNIYNPGSYLNYNKTIETSDAEYRYFIRINERIREGEIAPFEMVRENIHSVLLNKRKIEYIQNLENTVYKEGASRNYVEIF